MIGERLGNWILQREIGQGGMGRVYLAVEDAPTGRTAAVKVLTAALAADAGFLVRFQREAEILRRLNHPNVVAYYDDGAHRGHAWIAMEYVDGLTCEDMLQSRGRLPWQEVLEIALQVSLALKHAHDHGVIHRDLKPSNLLLGGIHGPERGPVAGAVYAIVPDPGAPQFVVKLTDFGIATAFAATPLTVPGSVVGTAEYLSPEQAAGKPVTKRSDLYSLGAVLYTLLTGRTPFQGKSPVELLHKHQFAQFDRPLRVVPELPHDLDEIICQLLEKDPARRPADAGVLHRQLDRIRRKLERRAGGATDEELKRAETQVGESSAPRRRGAGPATLVSQFVREELEAQNRGGPVQQFFNRPLVLVALLMMCLAVIVWTFWPVSAESLFLRGQTAMSQDPPQWEEADEALTLLEQRYPDHGHQEEVAEWKQRIQELRAERSTPWYRVRGEVQTLYEQGLRLRQQGDEEAAQRLWLNLVNVFRDLETEKKWVSLAEAELVRPSKRAQVGETRWAPVREALKRARELKEQGRAVGAEEIWRGLEALYAEDPSAAEVLQELQRDREAK